MLITYCVFNDIFRFYPSVFGYVKRWLSFARKCTVRRIYTARPRKEIDRRGIENFLPFLNTSSEIVEHMLEKSFFGNSEYKWTMKERPFTWRRIRVTFFFFLSSSEQITPILRSNLNFLSIQFWVSYISLTSFSNLRSPLITVLCLF